jgi:hypothetical protein
MRDNSGIDNLTKVITQTSFQPKYTFKMESERAMIFRKLRGIVMNTIAIRNSSIAFGIDEDLKRHFREIGRISFDANREDVESYELPIEDSESLPRTREVAKSIKKILNRLINNWIVTSSLTLDIYDNFIDAYETDPNFKPQGEILEILALTYDCYIQAYLTDISSKPNFWIETPEIFQQEHLENFQSLLEWRLENSFKISFADRISLFLNLTRFAYDINIENLINDYKNNMDIYIKNISNVLIKNVQCNFERILGDKLNDINISNSRDGLSTDNSKDFFWNPKAYDYSKEQGEIFDCQVSRLTQDFGGKYIIFENGKVIDSDDDEMTLLDRIAETSFYRERPDAIFCTFVPRCSSLQS